MADKKLTVLQLWGNLPVDTQVWRGSAKPIETVNNDLIAGLELEIENLPDGQGNYMDRAGKFWSVVEDGSLRPRGEAWEFVSRPAHLNVMLGELNVLFSKLKLSQANYTDRCSVHVHTNVQDFTQDQLAGLALVYPVFEEVLFQYVNHYKKLEDQGYCRDTNLYCIPWSSCRMNRRFITNMFDAPDIPVRGWQKYTALNLLPIREHGTVEWRHMHGTCDLEKLTTWINVIGAIMKYCKKNSLDDIIKTIKIMNDVSTYKQFFDDVLLGTLPYEEQYRGLLREGILNSKYSLINFDPNKPAKDYSKKKSTSELLREIRREINEDEAVDDRLEGVWPAEAPVNTVNRNPQPVRGFRWDEQVTQRFNAGDWMTGTGIDPFAGGAVPQVAPTAPPQPTFEQIRAAQREQRRQADIARRERLARNRT